MSIMSLAALALYGAAIVSALSAARRSRHFRRPRRDTWLWLAIAAAFAFLLAFRMVSGEDIIRENLRAWIKATAHFADRRTFQAPLTVAVLVTGALAAAAAWSLWLRRSADREVWMLRLALLAVAGFVPLYALRLISLHAIDAILYAGPVRLNWILELGLCLTVLASGIVYGETVKRSHSPRERSDRP